MSPASTSPSLTPVEARTECVGTRLTLQVLTSAAGHYIGTIDEEGPVSRESVEYFPSHDAAIQAMTMGEWTQRLHP